MELMFQGIERFNAPKSKSKKEDWRKDIQVESQKKKMKVIGFALNAFGALAGLGAPFIGFKVKVFILQKMWTVRQRMVRFRNYVSSTNSNLTVCNARRR